MMSKVEVINYIRAGKKIQAIKYVRDNTGIALKNAKEYVDEIERQMKRKPVKDKQTHVAGMMSKGEVVNYIRDGKKFQAIKYVRDNTGIALKDAKEYVNKVERQMECKLAKDKQLHGTGDISVIDSLGGHEFEYFCAELLQKVGFTEVNVTPGSGDQGVDILAMKDGIKYAIQCKNYASALGNTPVQEVAAGKQFYGSHVGVVMTNSTFTKGAVQLASATNVLLWDRKKLSELISAAGGLASLGIYSKYHDLEIDDLEIDDSEIDDSEIDSLDTDDKTKKIEFKTSIKKPGNNNLIVTTKRPRIGMGICAALCLAWSAVCFFIAILALAFGDKEMLWVGLGEGVFVLILGLMFKELAKSEKSNPYITLWGRIIEKPKFVIICILIAFAFIFFAMGKTDIYSVDMAKETENQISIEMMVNTA